MKRVKKLGVLVAGSLLMCTFTGCTFDLKEVFKGNGEKEDIVKNIEERIVILGVEYSSKLLGEGDDNTEITLYLDDMEIGTMNCGDEYNFEVSLPLGEHELSVTRNMLDKDKCVFNVEKVQDVFLSEQEVGFKYTFHSLTSNGELEENDFSYSINENYIYIDINEADIDAEKVDTSKAVDLSDMIQESENGKQLIEKLETECGVEFTKSADATEFEYMSERISISNDEEDFNILIDRAYNPIYLIDGIWCGMKEELAQESLKKICDENYGYTLIEEAYSVQIGDDLIAIFCNGGKVRNILYMKNSYMLEFDEDE